MSHLRSYALRTGLVVALLATPRLATAQEVAPGSAEGDGIKVGEGTVIHPTIGLETGVVSNVFYEDSNANFAGLARVIAEFSTGSLSGRRLSGPQLVSDDDPGAEQGSTTGARSAAGGDLSYRASLRLAYEEWLSGNDNVRAQRDLAIGANVRGVVYPRRTWSFGFEEDFVRAIRPTNFEGPGDLNRDINHVKLQLNYQPIGRTLSGFARYQNTIDVFEGDNKDFANRMQHTIGVRSEWRPFPYTMFYADASLGFYGGLGGDSTKVSSLPLRTVIGAQSSITVDTTVSTRVGFAKGFYSAGPDYTMAIFGAQVGHRFSPQARATLLYDYDFQDSVNANFYRDHALRLRHDQQIGEVVGTADVGLIFRTYRGVLAEVMGSSPDRSDLMFTAHLGLARTLRTWLVGTIDYNFVTDQTDYMQLGDDPSYTRHELLVGLRAAL
ncbi:MAG: hypothetical protein R2939_03525 [Kofleriaceae bacterium]